MTPAESPILVAIADGVMLVTIDRPKRSNSLDARAVCELADLWERIGRQQSLRAVVITGSGSTAFCAGADLASLIPLLAGARRAADVWDERVLADPTIGRRAILTGVDLDVPVIAAVNGAAVAGGCELLLNTDIRIAVRTARFGLPEVQRGLVAAGGGIVQLSRQLPRQLAVEMLLTGDTIDADTAARAGLVGRIVPAADLISEALNLAARISAHPTLAVRTIKRILRETNGIDLGAALDIEFELGQIVWSTSDPVEGAAAFVEHRSARFNRSEQAPFDR
jgi:enoyl-CoA hydratase/carnithine racemase